MNLDDTSKVIDDLQFELQFDPVHGEKNASHFYVMKLRFDSQQFIFITNRDLGLFSRIVGFCKP